MTVRFVDTEAGAEAAEELPKLAPQATPLPEALYGLRPVAAWAEDKGGIRDGWVRANRFVSNIPRHAIFAPVAFNVLIAQTGWSPDELVTEAQYDDAIARAKRA